jgi:hypothetical protein
MQSGVTTNYQGGRRAQTEEAARERVREGTDGKTPARLPERPEYRPLNTMPPPECATCPRVAFPTSPTSFNKWENQIEQDLKHM